MALIYQKNTTDSKPAYFIHEKLYVVLFYLLTTIGDIYMMAMKRKFWHAFIHVK